MNTTLLDETTRIQQDLRLVRATVEALQARVDELVARLQAEAEPGVPAVRLTDLEGIWKGADFSLEAIQAAEYKLPADLL